MYELKTGLDADKFATFGCFQKGFYLSFVLRITLIHSRNGYTQIYFERESTFYGI